MGWIAAGSKATKAPDLGGLGHPRLQPRHPRHPHALRHFERPGSPAGHHPREQNGRAFTRARPFSLGVVYPGEVTKKIENEGFEGSPKLAVDRLIEEGETVVAPHIGEVKRSDGGMLRFAAIDVFTFDGDLITRVEYYVVPVET